MVHRSTFYRYYEDKYILLNGLVEETIKALYDDLPVSEVQMPIAPYIIDYINDNLTFFKHISTDSSDYLYESLDQFISQLLLKNAEKYDDVLSLKIRNAKHPELVSEFYSSGMRKILKKWIIDQNNQYTKEEILEFSEDILK